MLTHTSTSTLDSGSVPCTPLSICVAVQLGHMVVVKLLIRAGANVNASNSQGASPIHITCCSSNMGATAEGTAGSGSQKVPHLLVDSEISGV